LKGILEGVTFDLRQSLENLPETGISPRVRVAGGGSKSDIWCAQRRYPGRPFVRTAHPGGSLGAAILARTATGAFASLEQGCQAMLRLGRRFEPDSARSEAYSGLYENIASWPLMADYLRRLEAEKYTATDQVSKNLGPAVNHPVRFPSNSNLHFRKVCYPPCFVSNDTD
jgi:xylulokinase